MKRIPSRVRVIRSQILAFLALIAFVWVDEVLDLPHLVFNAPTPLNWRESLFETIVIALVGIVCVLYTRSLLRRIKSLEGMLPICARCKRIRDAEGNWQPMESYISQRSHADFTHGICPECSATMYPDASSKGK